MCASMLLVPLGESLTVSVTHSLSFPISNKMDASVIFLLPL